jgi:UDP-N-acetylglucosamine diphosphorylase/glucosamine-1-phosphate N-acetyltransferase
MISLLLEDNRIQPYLYPFTNIRSAAEIRIGILTIREKWELLLGQKVFTENDTTASTEENPTVKFGANIVPGKEFVTALLSGNYSEQDFLQQINIRLLQHPWHIFEYNDWALREDFKLITQERNSLPIPESVSAANAKQIFLEEGAQLQHCILNASTGPIYIGKNAEIMEGAIIRGPFALCEGAVVKAGTRIYGATTIGPHSVVGGEIKNTVIFGYSNKAHDGYLGDSVIGAWCNLGAGTSNSNIKNTAGTVKVWNNATSGYVEAGLKCGVLMGDYSRCAINTSFNTGTVVGVCCNITQSGLTAKHIPNFSWGNTRYQWEKVEKDIANWKKLKNEQPTNVEIELLYQLYNASP